MDFRERANSCERLADTAISPETRETMLYLAARWHALADEDEARRRPLHGRPATQRPFE